MPSIFYTDLLISYLKGGIEREDPEGMKCWVLQPVPNFRFMTCFAKNVVKVKVKFYKDRKNRTSLRGKVPLS